MNNPTIDCTGRRWVPRRGDLVRDLDTGACGVVLAVHQTGNAPAMVTVSLDTSTGNAPLWRVFERSPEQLERDTSDDIELPSFAEMRATMTASEASAVIASSIVELAGYRARAGCDDDLVGVLEIEAIRALNLSTLFADRKRYDLAARERELARHLRELACAVSVQLAQRPSCG